MRKVEITCDMCGVGLGSESIESKHGRLDVSIGAVQLDVCKECARKLFLWIERQKGGYE